MEEDTILIECNQNNCYNWALKRFDDDYKQPGEDSGEDFYYSDYDGEAPEIIRKAAIADGYCVELQDVNDNWPKEDYWPVALLVSDGGYHWLRLDADGTWSHKQGWDYPVSGLDLFSLLDQCENYYGYKLHCILIATK